ncbi:threonine dehydratase [Bradyrhizobium sp. USDA 3650]
MAMLECYEPSLVAWRILSRTADAFMTVDDEDAISVMKRLANPRMAIPLSLQAKMVVLASQHY